MKICSVLMHGLFVPKLDWHMQNPGRMCWIYRKNYECVGVASVVTFAPYGPDSETSSVAANEPFSSL